MSNLQIFYLVLKMIRSNSTRTILTVLGVSIGIAAINGFVGIGFGLQRITESTVATTDALTTLDVLSPSDQLPLDRELIERWASEPNVAEVSKLISVPAQVSLEGKNSDTQMNLIDVSYLKLSGLEISAGTGLTTSDQAVVVVSSAVAKLFGVEDVSALLGKELTFALFVEQENGEEILIKKDQAFAIVGVFQDDQLSQAYLPFQQFPEFSPNEFHALKIKVDSKENLIPIRDKVADEGYTVSSVAEFVEQIDKVFNVVQVILAVFGFIALFVSSIGMFNTMTIALLERTRDIGIMKAVGVENRDVWRLFVSESTIIGMMGGLCGIFLGMVIGEVLNFGINLLASSLGGQSLDIYYTPLWFILAILVVSLSVGILTGVYPARRAAKINLLDALRYE